MYVHVHVPVNVHWNIAFPKIMQINSVHIHVCISLHILHISVTEAGGSQDHPKHKPHARMGGIVAEMLVRTIQPHMYMNT